MIDKYADDRPVNYLHLLKDIRKRGDRTLSIVNQQIKFDRNNSSNSELSDKLFNEVTDPAQPLATKIKTFLEGRRQSVNLNKPSGTRENMNSTGNIGSDFQPEPQVHPGSNSNLLDEPLIIFIINEGLSKQKSQGLWSDKAPNTPNTDLKPIADPQITEKPAQEILNTEKAMSDRYEIEAALRESETKNRSLLNAIPDLMFRLNQEGIFLDYFPAKDDPNVPATEQFIGQSLEDVLSADLAFWTRYYLEQTLATGQPQAGEYNLRENKTWKHYEARYVPCGETEVLAIVRDITIRKQMEADLRLSQVRERDRAIQVEQTLQQLKQTQTQLIQAEKMSALGSMVAGIAHEINNPTSFIYGNVAPAIQYIQDLLELVALYQQHYPKEVPSEIEEHIENIELDFLIKDLPKLLSSMKMGAERIREIVKSLRNFSRLDEGEKKPVDIHEGIENTLLILQHRLKAKGDRPAIAIEKEYGKIPELECYAGLMNQVFMNIISNAIDALESYDLEHQNEVKKPHKIRIFTEISPENYLIIRIADNGPGIPESVHKRLFDPFFTTKPVGKGTGLGLSISYSIVEKHRGQLQCISEVGKGTEFIINIPLYLSERN